LLGSGGKRGWIPTTAEPTDVGEACQSAKIRLMTGVQFVTDSKGRKVAVLVNLKKHGARLQDFWDGLISESRRREAGIPLEKIKADLIKRGRLRG